jgi:hypothetical protein
VIALLIAAVIAIWLLALQVWNITTLTRSLATIQGFLRLLAGAAIGFGALLLLYAALPAGVEDAFSLLSIVTFVTALAVEFTIGDDLRHIYTRKL